MSCENLGVKGVDALMMKNNLQESFLGDCDDVLGLSLLFVNFLGSGLFEFGLNKAGLVPIRPRVVTETNPKINWRNSKNLNIGFNRN